MDDLVHPRAANPALRDLSGARPEENHARFYEHLLRRNRRLTGLKLQIGDEDAVFLAGATPVACLTEAALDGVLGSMYAAVELIFRPAMRIGYASKFRG